MSQRAVRITNHGREQLEASPGAVIPHVRLGRTPLGLEGLLQLRVLGSRRGRTPLFKTPHVRRRGRLPLVRCRRILGSVRIKSLAHFGRLSVLAGTAFAAPENRRPIGVATTAVRLEAKRYFRWKPKVETIHGVRVQSFDYQALAHLYEEVFVRRVYEVGDLGTVPSIVDCGANIGIASIYFALRHPHSSVTAYEPDPQTFAVLTANVRHLPQVTPINAAVGAVEGTIDLHIDDSRPGSPLMSTIAERGAGRVAPVSSVRLSDCLPEKVDLLKVDIEGAERRLLADLCDDGAIRRVTHLAVECHHHMTPGDEAIGDLVTMLVDAGFTYSFVAQPWWPGDTSSQSDPGGYQDVMLYARRRP